MSFRFSKASYEKLDGVRTELICVAALAIQCTKVDFRVTEGLRTLERQKELIAAGASWTLNSRHLDGRAIDVVALVGSEVRWDFGLFFGIAEAMREGSVRLEVPIVWGAYWGRLDPALPLDRCVAKYVAECNAAGREPKLDGAHFELME